MQTLILPLLFQAMAISNSIFQEIPESSSDPTLVVISENRIFLECPSTVCYGINTVRGSVRNVGTANGGPYPVTGVKVNGQLGGTLDLLGGTVGQGMFMQGQNGEFTFNIGAMAPNQIVLFEVVVSGGGPQDNVQVQLMQNEFNPGTMQMASCQMEYVACADITTDKRASKDTVTLEEEFTFEVVVRNNGPDEAINAWMVDEMSVPFEVIGSAMGSDCQVNQFNNHIECNLGTLAAGDSVVVTIRVKGVITGMYANRVRAGSSSIDPLPGNNFDTIHVAILDTIADVAVEKTAQVEDVKVGDPVIYTIKVTNNGPQTAFGVILMDDLPVYHDQIGGSVPNLDLEAPPAGCELADHTLTCDIGTMAPGEVREFTYTGYALAKKNLRNLAQVTSTGPADPHFFNNSSLAKVHVIGDFSSSGGNPNGGVSVDPVSTYSGEFYFTEESDMLLRGSMDLHFDRYYASYLHRDNISPGVLGYNWSHNFDWRLVRRENFIEIYSYKGKVFAFELSGGAWQSIDEAEHNQLKEEGQQYLFVHQGSNAVFTFDDQGKLLRVNNLNGMGADLTYQNGRLHTISDGLGRILTCAYHSDGLLAEVTDGMRSAKYRYTDSVLIAFENAAGFEVTYAYDESHTEKALLTERFLPGTQQSMYTQEYDVFGRVVLQHDAFDNPYALSYDILKTVVTDPRGHTTLHEYMLTGELIAASDPNGNRSFIQYDTEGRRSVVISPRGDTTWFEYDAVSGLVNSIRTAGQHVRVSYTGIARDGFTFYKQDTVTYTSGLHLIYEYDDRGNVTAITNRSGDRMECTYDVRGLRTAVKVISEAASTRTWEYADHGLPVSYTDGEGETTTYTYDPFHRLVQVDLPEGLTHRLDYDMLDRLLSWEDEAGNVMTYHYDESGNLIAIHHSSGVEMALGYDALMRQSMIVDPQGDTIRIAYDAAGNVSTFTDRMQREIPVTYDASDLPASIDLGGNVVYAFGHDPAGILDEIIMPSGRRVEYTLNAEGLITEVVLEGRRLYQYTYNDNGAVTGMTFPSGKQYSFGYTGDKTLATVDLPENIGVQITSDAVGRALSITDPNGNIWQQRFDREFRLSEAEDPLGNVWRHAYDGNHRLTEIDGPGGSLSFEYAPDGLPERLVYSDGTEFFYTYDNMGRLVSSNGINLGYDATGNIILSNDLPITRDKEGRILSVQYADDFLVYYQYDNTGRLTGTQDSHGNAVVFVNAPDGDVREISRSNGTLTLIARDAQYRIGSIAHTQANGDTIAAYQITYDADDQLLSARRNQQIVPDIESHDLHRSYNAINQIAGYTYDAKGHLVDDTERTYSWNGAGQMTELTHSGSTVVLADDGFGNLLTRTDEHGTTRFVWNYGLEMAQPALQTLNGDATHYHVFTPHGDLVYTVDLASDKTYFYHFDERGNTSAVTDASGDMIASFAYTPYGVATSTGASESVIFTFGGRYGTMREQGTSLYRMHHRYYDPATQRFLSGDGEDLRLDPRDINPYVYALQSPMNYVDPYGRDPQPAQSDGVGLDAANSASAGAFVTGTIATGLDILPALPKLPSGVGDFVVGSPGAPNALSMAGKHLDNARDLAKTGLNAANQGFGHLRNSFTDEAINQFNKASKWKTAGKVANGAGNILAVYNIFNVLKKTNGHMDQATDRFVDEAERIVNTEGKQIDELIRLLKEGKISRSEFERRVRIIQQQVRSQLETHVSNFKYNLGFEFLNGFAQSLEAFLPNPTDASLTDGILDAMGSDTSIFRE